MARNENEGTAKKAAASQTPIGGLIRRVCRGSKPALGRSRTAHVKPVVVGPQVGAYGAQEAVAASDTGYSRQTQGVQLTKGRGTESAPGTSPRVALQRLKTKWTRTKTKWSRGVAEMPLPDRLRHSPTGKAGTVACDLGATSIKKHTGTNRLK